MNGAWLVAVTRLTALLTCVGLATSRIGLVVHELVGHGGATLAVGGSVTEVQLFYVAGGWIRYQLAGPGTLADGIVVMLGGIVVELVIGGALWLGFARRAALGARIARACGAALIIHASWYLATGTWHGYGDGVLLHRVLGDDRWLVAMPAGVIVCGIAFLGARWVLGPLAATVPGGRRAQIGGAAIGVVLAGGLQLGAALGEVALRRDATYGATMRPERERVISRELAAWMEEQARRGPPPTSRARIEKEQELARRHHTFPFAIVLGACTLLAIGAGAWRSRGAEATAISSRLLVRAALIAGGSVAVVIALDAAFH